MALRRHVIGAYGASEEELRAALGSAGCERFRFGCSGKWQWALASVWHVNGADIDEALGGVSVPAIRATSSDGVLWTLTLTSPGREPFRGVHFFTQVGAADVPHDEQDADDEHFDGDFPRVEEVAGISRFVPALAFLWDEEEEARIASQWEEPQAVKSPVRDEYASYRVSLPAETVEQIEQEPKARGWQTAFRAHCRQIVDALAEYGIDCDRDVLFQFLTVGPLSQWEQHSDLGNLPRFVKLLGIEGIFEEEAVLDATTAETETEEDAEDEVPDWSEHEAGRATRTNGRCNR